MGGRGDFSVFTLLHVSEPSEHFCFCLLFWWGKINYFHGWGVPPSPPFAENSAKIINLIFEPFPNPLCKIFNRHTVKLGYKCMPNMASAVAMHNKKLLQEDQQDADLLGCNCQDGPAVCPVQGRCLTKSVIYRATVTETASGQVETYTIHWKHF